MRCSTVFVVSGIIWKLDVTFNDLNNLFNQIQQSLSLKDPLGLEHYKSKLERCIPIVSSILLCISNESIESHVRTATQNENQQPEGQTLVTLRSLVESD